MQPVMGKVWSYIKDSQDLINESRKLGKISHNAILVTADVLGLYPSIPHNVGLRALKEALDKRKQKRNSHRGPLSNDRVCFEKYFF